MELEQNEKIKIFLDTVCSQIKWRETHDQIKLELLSHIGELVEEYEQAGTPREDAVNQTLSRMGNARELGKNLHSIHKPRLEWIILALVGFFLGLGLFMLYALETNGLLLREPASLFTKSLIFTLVGVLTALGMYFFNYRHIKPLSWPIYIGTLVVWFFVLWLGPLYMGKPYLHLGFISIDFAQAAPFLLAIALAGIFADWDWQQPHNLIKALGLLIIPVLMALMTPSLVAVFLYTLVFLVMARASGAKIKDMGLIFSVPLAFIIISLVTHPYRIERLLAILNPYRDPRGSGYTIIQSMEAIRSAGFWGRGFDFPMGILPQLHTDFIFTYIVYSFGWITGAAVVVLATALLVRVFRISRLVKDRYGQLMVSGLVGMLIAQFYWNILMTLGLAPLAGFGLPLISYGGTQLIIQLIMLGLVLSIYRRKDVAITI